MRIAMIIIAALAAALVATPSRATFFFVVIKGTVTGTQTKYICNPLLQGCSVTTPLIQDITKILGPTNLVEGGNDFTDNPLSVQIYPGYLTGTIIKNGDYFTGVNLFFAFNNCPEPIPVVGCIMQSGKAPTFEVFGVAEPATWAMMIAGFGVVGLLVRRRRYAINFGSTKSIRQDGFSRTLD